MTDSTHMHVHAHTEVAQMNKQLIRENLGKMEQPIYVALGHRTG